MFTIKICEFVTPFVIHHRNAPANKPMGPKALKAVVHIRLLTLATVGFLIRD
jgi:hypothetical protein